MKKKQIIGSILIIVLLLGIGFGIGFGINWNKSEKNDSMKKQLSQTEEAKETIYRVALAKVKAKVDKVEIERDQAQVENQLLKTSKVWQTAKKESNRVKNNYKNAKGYSLKLYDFVEKQKKEIALQISWNNNKKEHTKELKAENKELKEWNKNLRFFLNKINNDAANLIKENNKLKVRIENLETYLKQVNKTNIEELNTAKEKAKQAELARDRYKEDAEYAKEDKQKAIEELNNTKTKLTETE